MIRALSILATPAETLTIFLVCPPETERDYSWPVTIAVCAVMIGIWGLGVWAIGGMS